MATDSATDFDAEEAERRVRLIEDRASQRMRDDPDMWRNVAAILAMELPPGRLEELLAAPQNAEPKKPKKRGARLVWTLTRKLELANQLDTFRSADPRRAKKGVDALIKDAATKRGQMFDWARQDSSGRLENIVGEVNQWRAKRRNPAVRRLIQAKLRSWSMGSRFSAKRAMRELVAGKKIGADKEAQIMRAAEQLEAINSNPLYREGAVEAISIATGRRLQAFGLILRKR